jgi:hypothetical protein
MINDGIVSFEKKAARRRRASILSSAPGSTERAALMIDVGTAVVAATFDLPDIRPPCKADFVFWGTNRLGVAADSTRSHLAWFHASRDRGRAEGKSDEHFWGDVIFPGYGTYLR